MHKSLDLILRQWSLVRDFESSTHAIACFLGPSCTLSLSKACNFGSIQLLDWIWDSSCVSCWDRRLEWSLTKYLRSDVHYYRWQFTKSLEMAAGRGDVAIVKWLFEHFEGCEAPSSVIDAAVTNGHLSVLQFLLPFKAKGLEKCAKWNVVHWREDVMVRAAQNDRVQVLQWLYDNNVHDVREDQRVRIIECALRNGDFELADHLLPLDEGLIVLDYDRLCPTPELIDWMMELGYFRWDEHAAGSAIRDLAGTKCFELMQQIFLLHSPLQEYDTHWLEYWGEALEKACACGDLLVLKWLMEHPLGRKRCQSIKQIRYMDDLLCVAVGADHINVVRYLHDEGAEDRYGNALLRAARQRHAGIFQWLLEKYSYTTQTNGHLVIYEAVSHGNVDILALFHKFDSTRANESSVLKRKKTPANSRWDRLGDIMELAAARGQLEVLKWFHLNRTLKSSQKAMNKAAAHGHLDVVKWLHSQAQKSSQEAMDYAASTGYLNVVQWLHSNRAEGCTTDAMDLAAKGGHLNVIKWIHANRTEGCSNKAIENAVTHGHVGVAYWLTMHASEQTLEDVDIVPNDFEMLLFLHEHFSHVITARTINKIQRRAFAKADPCHHVASWLAERYSA